MLEKLRSRHPIDLPAEEWGTSRGLLGALGTLALLFVLLPLLAALYAAVRTRSLLLGVGAAIGALLVVLLLLGMRGKPGHARK